MRSIELLQQYRRIIVAFADDLAPHQLTAVPAPSRNNILWNLGHLAVTQQLLCYGLAGLPLGVSEELVAQCRKGTAPADWQSSPDFGEIRDLLLKLPERLAEDYRSGRFERFDEYTTSAGVRLTSIEQAIDFNNFHEGIHRGVMLVLRRLTASG